MRSHFTAAIGLMSFLLAFSQLTCDIVHGQGNSGRPGGGGGGGGGGGSTEPELQLPNYRFRVEKVDTAAIANQLGAVGITGAVRNSNLDLLGHANFADGSFQPYLSVYTDQGYQTHLLGSWPEEIFFYLDPEDPTYDPDSGISPPSIMRLTDDMVAVLRIRRLDPVPYECDDWEYRARRNDFVAVPIIEDVGGYSLGEPAMIGSRHLDASGFFDVTSSSHGDILYHSRQVIDPDAPCEWRQEAGIYLRPPLGGFGEIDLIEELASHGYDVDEVNMRISRLNSSLHVIGTLGSSVYHYDPVSDVLSTTEVIRNNLGYLNVSEHGIVVGDKNGASLGTIWDPLSGQLVDIPLDLGSAPNTRLVPLSVRDLDELSGPSDVQVLGRIWNTASDNRVHVPVYFEAGEAFFLQDLVTDNSPDSTWFRNLDPPRLYYSSGTISGDGNRLIFRASSLLFSSISATVTDSSLVILHRVELDDDDPTLPDMTVSGIEYNNTGPNGRRLEVTITVGSGNGSLPGAAVSATLHNLTTNQFWNYSGNTNNNGQVTFSRNNAPSGVYALQIHTIEHPDYEWDGQYDDPGHQR